MTANISHRRNGDWLDRVIDTGTPPNDPAVESGSIPARHLRLSLADGQLTNDGADVETVTVEVVDGLEVVRGTDPADATVLNHDGDVTLTIDDVEMTKTLAKGSVAFDLTTEKPAGSTIEIVAESLADHPAESDRAEIEVIQA